jgi:hypothetical protein
MYGRDGSTKESAPFIRNREGFETALRKPFFWNQLPRQPIQVNELHTAGNYRTSFRFLLQECPEESAFVFESRPLVTFIVLHRITSN